jgi:hypothetical protein
MGVSRFLAKSVCLAPGFAAFGAMRNGCLVHMPLGDIIAFT